MQETTGMRTTTIALDFDGVIHSYTSGWEGVSTISDPPVDGAIEWLRGLIIDPRFRVVVHSCRLTMGAESDWHHEPVAYVDRVKAVLRWLTKHGMSVAEVSCLEFWGGTGKPHADVYIDDRGYRFTGEFPSMSELHHLRPWNKAPHATGA